MWSPWGHPFFHCHRPKQFWAALGYPGCSPTLRGFEGSQASDQNQGVEGDKEKDKGEKRQSSLKAKNATKDEGAAANTKEAEAQTKEANPKAKDAPTSQPNQKEDPPTPKSKA